MNISKRKAFGIAILTILVSSGFIDHVAAHYTTSPAPSEVDPYGMVARYKKDLEKIQSDAQAQDFFYNHVKDEFGLSKDLMDFVNQLAGGTYTKQIELLSKVTRDKMEKAGLIYPYLRYKEHLLSQTQIQSTALNNVTEYMKTIGKGLTYLSLASDIKDAIAGDDEAKLKSVAGTFKL
ncbi:MAG: hypothetical protein ACRENG_35990, partial [bacterium]